MSGTRTTTDWGVVPHAGEAHNSERISLRGLGAGRMRLRGYYEGELELWKGAASSNMPRRRSSSEWASFLKNDTEWSALLFTFDLCSAKKKGPPYARWPWSS